MAIDNYENLGFQVNIDGADTVETHLGKIVKRLKQIQQLNKALGNITSKSAKGSGSGTATTKEKLSEEAKYIQRVERQTELLKSAKYEDLRATELQNQALKRKISYDLISNNNALRSAEVEAKIAQLRAQTAIQTELLANSEWQSLVAKQTQNRYQEQQIRQMARLQAEQEALNNGKFEEARRIELANQARKKEIDQRLKQELGLNDNTNSLQKYLAKLTSILVVARKLGRFISDAIQESANYVENLNLFAVAYGDVYEETLDWALNLADGFGLANNEVLKFAGTFRQLSTSLGLVENTANSVSQTVTQLGYDMAALFNTTVENAMEKLQSGLFSGNVRPLRSYGIDISQNQIDALFKTNEALAKLGVNARNLSQSDKVLARLIITLRDGSNAFGTMNREINTLQSQIRILQGSFSNFKLAIGDLVYEPTRLALVILNAFIIAATNVIRILAPLKKKDENNVFNGVAMGAEEANSEIDELNSKLATFDKFNVLGGGTSQDLTNTAITDALTAELAKQQEYYAQQVALMDDIQNEAKELAKWLEPVVLFMGAMAVVWTVNKIQTTKAFMTALTTGMAKMTGTVAQLNKGISWTSVLLVTGIVWAVLQAVKAFKEGDWVAFGLATTLGVVLAGAFIYLKREAIKGAISSVKTIIQTLFTFNKMALGSTALAVTSLSFAFIGLASAVAGAFALFANWGDMNTWQKIIGVVGVATTAILGLAMAFGAFHSAWSMGLAAVGIAAGIAAIVASVATVKKEVEQPVSYSAHALGGYSNANLIMTHENGKREWVGKAAGSSAIVNDTQMSDIMETAVAKGVYRAMSSSRTDGGSGGTTKNVYNFQVNGRTLLSVMEDEARKQGKALQRI